MDFVIKNPEHDRVIANIIRKSDYYSMWKVMESETPWDYNSSLLKEHYGRNYKLAAESLMKLAEDAISRFESMQLQFMVLDLNYDLETLSTFVNLYKDLVISSTKRLTSARTVLVEE